MPTMHWQELLKGLQWKHLQGNIYSVQVSGLGESEVGPYEELIRYAKKFGIYKLPYEVHHIVNGEHLEGTGWLYKSAPCIVLEDVMHQQYHGRFSQILPIHHGRDMVGRISQRDALALYHEVFVEDTGWRELWPIAARILTGSVAVPNPSVFQDA